MKKVLFNSDGQTVKGTLYFPQKPKKINTAIMFIHGWTSDQQSYSERAIALSKLGFICFTFDLRGHGDDVVNRDKFSRKDHLEDTLSAYDFLSKQENIDINNISVVGSSYGGYLAAILCDKRPIHLLTLRVPALYTNESFDVPTDQLVKNKNTFFQHIIPEEDNFALKGIKNFNIEFLLIESEFDSIIPRKIISYYKDSVLQKEKLTYHIMKGADHRLSKDIWQKEFIDVMFHWFKARIDQGD